jgi:arylsulfatase
VNIIFISMDTLRGDRLGCLGYGRGLTPNLDRIASEGTLFTQAFASDIPTQPSHTSIFTGRYGINTGIVSHFHPESRLDEEIEWLPSLLQSEGYATGAVDHLFAMKDWFVWGYKDYMPPAGRSRAPGETILDVGLPWLDVHRGEDLFLFLHFWDAHIPYVPPSPFKERFTAESRMRIDPLISERLQARPSYPLFEENLYQHLDVIPNLDYIADLYDAEVAYLDDQVGRLFAYLHKTGLADDTLVVLFGDHGENMTEHDAWFDHAGLYDAVVRVPVILWAPGTVPKGRVTSLISTVDIQPTVLELMGLPLVEGIDGRSLVPLMHGETSSHRDEVFLSECTWQAARGIRTTEWKFLRCIEPGVYPLDDVELYDLRVDPDEQHNVAARYPEVVAQLDARLSAWVSAQLASRPDPIDLVLADRLPAVGRLYDLIAAKELERRQAEQTASAL